MSIYDTPCAAPGGSGVSASAENAAICELLKRIRQQIDRTPFWRRVKLVDQLMEDELVPDVRPADERGLEIRPFGPFLQPNGAIVEGEWIVGADTNPDQRMLFIHGGGFVGGSPHGHRPLSMPLAELTNMAVCSIQYRTFPKFRRRHGLIDTRAAYQWMLEHGPDGPAACDSFVVAGDSAGGNISLMLLQWARDHQLRQADACVTFSPVVDVGLGSPSCHSNFEDDLILGHFFKRILRVPRFIRYPMTDAFHGGFPGSGRRASPEISPLFGDLANLPPTLIQGSQHELLLGDAVRYTNKARASGSQVEYETWPEMVHVFQMFSDTLPEAREALAKVQAFLQTCVPTTAMAN